MTGEQLDLEPAPRSAPQAREWLLDVLGPEPRYDVDVARLLLSELVTNAILHARTAFTVHVHDTGRTLRIAVSDTAADGLRPTAVTNFADDEQPGESGRGLQIVAMLAERWGVDRHAGTGATVWFELPAREGAASVGDRWASASA